MDGIVNVYSECFKIIPQRSALSVTIPWYCTPRRTKLNNKRKEESKRGPSWNWYVVSRWFSHGISSQREIRFPPTIGRHYDNISRAHDFFLITPSRQGEGERAPRSRPLIWILSCGGVGNGQLHNSHKT